ncbi:MAG: hypothetical protein Q9195_005775 [Heterodermia aff. obscurata]
MAGENNVRRPVRIIPAVPRKYEQNSSKPSVKDNDHGASQSKSHRTHAWTTVLPSADFTSGIVPTVQDFGIEKHGKLPPPFYPANSSPSHSRLPSQHGSPSPTENVEACSSPPTSSTRDGEAPAVLPLPRENYPKWSALEPAYPGNPTPPNEESPTPFHYSINAKTFHPQPTPPSDLTPPTSQSSYRGYSYPYNISFYPPETPEYVDSPSSAPSLYHGYSYVPSLIDANYSTDLYAPLDYINPPEAAGGGYLASSHQSSFSGADDILSQHQQVEIDRQCQSEMVVGSPLAESPSSDHGDILEKVDLLHSSGQHEAIVLETVNQCTKGNSLSSGPSAKERNPVIAEEYDTWRRTALIDLQNIPEEVWRQQMMMPSFFLQHFNSPRYADCRIHISDLNRPQDGYDLLLHSILLTYSPLLAAKLASSEPASDGIRLVHLDASDKFITPDAIESALFTCYGRPLCDFIGTTSDATATNAQDSATWMSNALAFAAAGQLLGLPAVVARGLQISMRILNWDNIEAALSFALYGQPKSHANDADNNFEPKRLYGDDDDAVSNDNTTTQQPGIDKIFPNTESLVASCLQMIVDQHPEDWRIDTSAPSLSSLDRLPEAREKPRNITKPQLSRIRFGDLSPSEPEETHKPTEQETQLSSIMISLPYPLVERILSDLQDRLTFGNIQSLVDERERRRQLAVLENPACTTITSSQDPHDPLSWEEYVETVTNSEGVHTRISRKWEISAGGLFEKTFFPTLPAFTSQPQKLGLEHSKFAKFFLVQFSSPISPNLPQQFSPISNYYNLEFDEFDSRFTDGTYPSFSPPCSSNNYHFSPVCGSFKHKPAPVALGMPNAVAFECEAVHEKADVQETRFGKIHYSTMGLI